ncbi:MAG: hypothetical protein QOJ85_2933 [Solirubrobacteraceae bacterium]|nr:hypothetical protein [Solirubrobacteraceae bacterium]MEA2243934.1 hypothetical protein [Solirubrobacteraceae bacterium]
MTNVTNLRPGTPPHKRPGKELNDPETAHRCSATSKLGVGPRTSASSTSRLTHGRISARVVPPAMTSSGDLADSRDVPSEDLAALVIAADRRGFSRWRVAIALGISARGLASIEERIELNARDDDR